MRGRIRIRPIRATDVSAVARLERAVFHQEAWPPAAFAQIGRIFVTSRPPRGGFWVAEGGNGRVVGYAALELSALGGEADIINLAVDPAYRRRGIGRRLLMSARAYCRARGVLLLWLRVRESNRDARAFYRRCGFRAVGRFRAYYDEPREDAVLMMAYPRP